MKFICSQKNFSKAIYKVENIATQNPVKAIAEYIYVEAKENTVFLITTNFQIMVKASFEAKVEKEIMGIFTNSKGRA